MSRKRTRRELDLDRGYVFHSATFWRLDLKVVQLMIPHRQQTDLEFYKALRKPRSGPDDGTQGEVCWYLNKQNVDNDKIPSAVLLYPLDAPVNNASSRQMCKLSGKTRSFKARDRVELDADWLGRLPLDKKGNHVDPKRYEQTLKHVLE